MKRRIKGLHRHHIIPKHAGGTDDDDNIVYLTLEEHIKAHEDRYAFYGDDADRRAILLLRRDISHSEVLKEFRKEFASKAARVAHEVKLKNGFYNKLGKANAERIKGTKNPEHSVRMKEKWKEQKYLWWTNGLENKRSVEKPGEEWFRGRTRK